ncbi:hypothetical protein HYQ44_013966 [Verticillium longisporum]|nr:hypothetical protein HYQ44_013966 [Verticillium longisporum]
MELSAADQYSVNCSIDRSLVHYLLRKDHTAEDASDTILYNRTFRFIDQTGRSDSQNSQRNPITAGESWPQARIGRSPPQMTSAWVTGC